MELLIAIFGMSEIGIVFLVLNNRLILDTKDILIVFALYGAINVGLGVGLLAKKKYLNNN